MAHEKKSSCVKDTMTEETTGGESKDLTERQTQFDNLCATNGCIFRVWTESWKKDAVFEFMRFTAIPQLIVENMFVARVDFRVSYISTTPAIWPMSRSNKGYYWKMYGFTNSLENVPSVVKISITDRDSNEPLSVDRLRVEVHGQWKPFRDFMHPQF